MPFVDVRMDARIAKDMRVSGLVGLLPWMCGKWSCPSSLLVHTVLCETRWASKGCNEARFVIFGCVVERYNVVCHIRDAFVDVKQPVLKTHFRADICAFHGMVDKFAIQGPVGAVVAMHKVSCVLVGWPGSLQDVKVETDQATGVMPYGETPNRRRSLEIWFWWPIRMPRDQATSAARCPI